MSKTVGQRMSQRRKELRLSVDELAQRLGKARATVYRYENGDIENLPLDLLNPIAEALEVSPSYLMGWESDNQQKEKPTAQDDRLSQETLELIECIKKLPEDKVQMLLQVARSIR